MNLTEQMNDAVSWAERKRNIEQLRTYVRGYMQERKISGQDADLPWWLMFTVIPLVIIGILLAGKGLNGLEKTGEIGTVALMSGILLVLTGVGIGFFLYRQYEWLKCSRALSWLASEEEDAVQKYPQAASQIPVRYLDEETMKYMQDLVYTGRVTSLQMALDKADAYQAQRNINGDKYYYNRETVAMDMKTVVRQCDSALGTTALQTIVSGMKLPSVPKISLPAIKTKHAHKSIKKKRKLSKN